MLEAIILALAGFLVFQIQPLFAGLVLPVFGGGASIWLTSLVFFQIFLFVGYWLSHYLASHFAPGKRILLISFTALLSLVFLPTRIFYFPSSVLAPAPAIFLLLTASLGLPYLTLSIATPSIQNFMASDKRQIRSPYIYFAASNIGSLLGLLSYPFLFEIYLGKTQQKLLWSIGYAFYIFLLFFYLVLWWKNNKNAEEKRKEKEQISRKRRVYWLFCSILPSASLLAITHYLTVDLVNFPFLWVAPLSVYLLSFILCFFFPALSQPKALRHYLCLIPVAVLLLLSVGNYYAHYQLSLSAQIFAGLASLFGICMYFHGELERDKPAQENLTTFYLYLCAGGALGGIAVSFVSPLVFASNFEFYLLLFLALFCMLLPRARQWKKASRMFTFIMIQSVFTIVLLMELSNFHPMLVYRGRSFYNSYKIWEVRRDLKDRIASRLLFQGTTIHGGQKYKKQLFPPITYYHEDTGIYRLFNEFPEIKKTAVIGLGTGVIALFAHKGQNIDFYEIDPLVVEIAQQKFEMIKNGQGNYKFFVGDGRVKLQKVADNSYDLLIMDAFTSDAVPAHLIHIEAFQEYLRVLKEDGLILVNISNRYLDLWPVLNGAAEVLRMELRHHKANEDQRQLKFPAEWVVLTRKQKKIKRLEAKDSRWCIKNNRKIYWTDDYSTIWPALKVFTAIEKKER